MPQNDLDFILQKAINELTQELIKYGKKIDMQERTGHVVGLIGIVIPILTWVFSYDHALSKTTHPNMWAMLFASSSIAVICGSMCTILLRHSARNSERIKSIESQIDIFRNIKIISSARISDLDKIAIQHIISQESPDISSFEYDEEKISNELSKRMQSIIVSYAKAQHA